MKKLILLTLIVLASVHLQAQNYDIFSALYNYGARFSEDDTKVLLTYGDKWQPLLSDNTMALKFDTARKVFSVATGQMLKKDILTPAINGLPNSYSKWIFYRLAEAQGLQITMPDLAISDRVLEAVKKDVGSKPEWYIHEVKYLGKLPEGDFLFYTQVEHDKKAVKHRFALLTYHPQTQKTDLKYVAYPSLLTYLYTDPVSLSRDGKYIYQKGILYDRFTLLPLNQPATATMAQFINSSLNTISKISATGDSILFYMDPADHANSLYIYNWRTKQQVDQVKLDDIPADIGLRPNVQIVSLSMKLPGVNEWRTFGYNEKSYQTGGQVEDISHDGSKILYKTSTRLWVYDRKKQTITFMNDQTIDRTDFLAKLHSLNEYLQLVFNYKQKGLETDIKLDEIRRAREERESNYRMAGKDFCPNCHGSGLVGVVEARQLTADTKYINANGNTYKYELGLTSYHNTGKTAACPVCGGSGYVKSTK